MSRPKQEAKSRTIVGPGNYYIVRRDLLEKFLDLDDQFKNGLKAVAVQDLPHWEKFTVEESFTEANRRKGTRKSKRLSIPA